MIPVVCVVSLQRLLEEWSSPPPFSPEAVDYMYITEQTRRLSLDGPKRKEQSPLISTTEDANDVTLTSLSTPGHRPQNKTSTRDSPNATPGFEESDSVIGEFSRELEKQGQSIDDQMMQEVANDMLMRRKWFSKKLEQLKRVAEEQKQQVRERREREARLKREREAAMEIERYTF